MNASIHVILIQYVHSYGIVDTDFQLSKSNTEIPKKYFENRSSKC